MSGVMNVTEGNLDAAVITGDVVVANTDGKAEVEGDGEEEEDPLVPVKQEGSMLAIMKVVGSAYDEGLGEGDLFGAEDNTLIF